MNDWIEQITGWLLEVTQIKGFWILLITIPLALLQGIVGVFPFATLVMLHISVLGVANGLLASWIAGSVAGMAVYLISKFMFFDWFNRKWLSKLEKYERWQKSLDRYGVWAVIFLRTIPIMPNNLISFMSAVSNLRTVPYTWSNIIGNLSSIWLFGILSASIVFPGMDLRLLILSYVGFLLVLLGAFFIRQRMMAKKDRSMTA
ncbi:putative membrane protein YdjX (TVP38/TMEM64 family) [Fontibacillus phaseoli]|uniref:TVP38/TMEM64 family membrane protein n=1 Tax=Fontibacillus phaseoli TaxID=1416533 RepID=A0A369BBG4_9BACL|nr:VTT domain-containing protein [Fontibacillus phaseoli]RCX17004.1 putative membrane protein YdjX (TVP38/TMEM64 family) [Fontibacillus phaseoli]